MNPLTNVRNTEKLNERELDLGLAGTNQSWHNEFVGSAYIFFGGLSYDLTEGDIITVFSQYGEVVDINLVRDKSTGESKGYGFLAYEDQRSTDLAVDNFNGIKVTGRVLRVNHVKDYRPVKDKEGDLIDTTCAPEAVIPESLKLKQKKEKKDKKKKKKKDKDLSDSDVDVKRIKDEPVSPGRSRSRDGGVTIKQEKDSRVPRGSGGVQQSAITQTKAEHPSRTATESGNHRRHDVATSCEEKPKPAGRDADRRSASDARASPSPDRRRRDRDRDAHAAPNSGRTWTSSRNPRSRSRSPRDDRRDSYRHRPRSPAEDRRRDRHRDRSRSPHVSRQDRHRSRSRSPTRHVHERSRRSRSRSRSPSRRRRSPAREHDRHRDYSRSGDRSRSPPRYHR